MVLLHLCIYLDSMMIKLLSAKKLIGFAQNRFLSNYYHSKTLLLDTTMTGVEREGRLPSASSQTAAVRFLTSLDIGGEIPHFVRDDTFSFFWGVEVWALRAQTSTPSTIRKGCHSDRREESPELFPPSPFYSKI